MSAKPLVKIDAFSGPAFVDPTQVVAVFDNGVSCELKFVSGYSLLCTEDASEVAHHLWGYRTEVDAGYINVDLIHAIEEVDPNKSNIILPGTKVTMNTGAEMLMSVAGHGDGLRDFKFVP